MSLSRRTVLRYGLGGAALLAVGGVGLGLRPGVLREPKAPLRALDAVAFSVLAAVAERVAPGGQGFPAASALGVPEKVDALLASSDPGLAAEVSQALKLLENALTGLLLEGRTRPFTACSAAEQDAVLESWRTSGLLVRRQVYKALRGLCASAYYASPETYAAVGYPGPPAALLAAARAEDAPPAPAGSVMEAEVTP